MIRFFVPGIPAPQGSHKAFMPRGARFPVITDDNAHTRPWRAMVALVGSQHGSGDLLEGALTLTAKFYLPRPRTLPKRITEPTRKPDLSKLIRAIEDALTGVLWKDDPQVVLTIAKKLYGSPGCEITIKPVEVERGEDATQATQAEAGVPHQRRGAGTALRHDQGL
jgi:crossover junction endodeoxyribonuclease RusA